MIDQFTKEQFEQALDNIMPLGWQPLGMDLYEYCYIIEVNANARIHIRSSVGASGIANEAGKDSIRLNLEVWQPDFRRNEHYDWIALPKKSVTSQRWVTRVPGWQERLQEKIRLYWDVAKEFRQPVEFCSCGKAPFVGISKSEKNEGRPYSSCLEQYGGCGLFIWLNKPLEGKVEFDASNTEETGIFESGHQPMAHLDKANIRGGQKLPDSMQSNDSQKLERRGHQQGTERANVQSLSQESQEARTLSGVENDSFSLQSSPQTISPSNEEETSSKEPVQDANSLFEGALSDNNPERDTDEECLSEMLEDSQENRVKDDSFQDFSAPKMALGGERKREQLLSKESQSRLDGKSSQSKTFEQQGDMQEVPQSNEEKEPNLKQLEAIQAPIDANVRVLAPPGSGKTFVIEQRYKHLVDSGVDPDNILVVTFSKSMADEMASRIQATCPFANIERISTIHAFCYRLLTKWDNGGDYYGWRVAGGKDSPVKSWEIKKWLDDFISDTWGEYEEKPGYQEVLSWIDVSKYHGYHYDDPECLEWFISILGLLYGKRVYDIRCKFDKALYQRKCMTFADMLLLTELKLKEDFAFRVWCQDKFSHCIIDEGQDTAYNAMRILITVAAEVGENPIYNKRHDVIKNITGGRK